MKGHRILGPVSITLGSVNVCIGFAWVGLRGAIIGYIMFTLLITIIIAGLVFMKNKRKMRQNAMNSTAAYNFRERQGMPMPQQGYYGQGQGVPMQPMQPSGMEHGRVEYYNVQPNK